MHITTDTMTSEASEHTATYHRHVDGWTVTYIGTGRFLVRDQAVSAILLAETVGNTDNPDELLDHPQIIDWAEHVGLPVEDAVTLAARPPQTEPDAVVVQLLKTARDSGLAYRAILPKVETRADRWAAALRLAAEAGATIEELRTAVKAILLADDDVPRAVRELLH